MERRILLSGPVNFRDLGGYDTADGRRVRWRRLFRSDSLSPVTADDARTLTEGLGLLAVVDLRTSREVERDGRVGLADVALHYHHVPLLEDGEVGTGPDRMQPSDRWLHEAYTYLLGRCAGRISEALEVIASEVAEHPTVFHCTAGKDRTGIVAALVLAFLGVSDADIVADYALTQEVMPTMIERFPRRALRSSAGDRYPSPILRAEAETMSETLTVLDEEYGSAAGWAEVAALDPAVVTGLRAALLN
jgi:protein tyrosine/serine phosphatase